MHAVLTFISHKATANAKDTLAYGTNVVGGVSPGKGGKDHLGLPVFDTVQQVMLPSLSRRLNRIDCILTMLSRPWNK